jgi:hypothetical protein
MQQGASAKVKGDDGADGQKDGHTHSSIPGSLLETWLGK